MKIYPPQTQIRGAMLILALALTLWCGVVSVAQSGEADRLNRDVERLGIRQERMGLDIERRYGALQSDIKVLQADLVTIKGELGMMKNLGLGIISSTALLIVHSIWGLIAARQKAKTDG